MERGKVTLEQGIKKGPGNKSGPQVAVIGGSASGFFTASLLARAGCSVEVLERADQLDPTPRTLIVTSHMRTLLGKVGEAAVVNEIRKFELFTDGRIRAGSPEPSRPDHREVAIDPRSRAGRAKPWRESFVRQPVCESAEQRNRVARECGTWPERARRGIARRRSGRRGRRAVARGAKRRVAAPADGSAGTGHRACSFRYVSQHRACLVRAGRHALFLLADSGIGRARGSGFDRRGRPGNAPLPGTLHGKARVHAARISGRENPGL